MKLRANGIYRVSFHGNIGGGTAATAVQLVIETGGEPLPETTMISVPVAATTEFNNVGTSTLLRNCCGDYDRVTVTNNGTTNVLIAPNTVLHIERVA